MANVPSRVVELIEIFDRNIDAYHSPQYNETQLRREFIDPFFETLGWDVTNKQGFAPQYREVLHENSIKISGETKAPDYSFRIGKERKFFLEAKKPSININTDPDSAYQLRRYAWSAKLPLSILTNFETFAVYDCQYRPKHTDRASTARIMLYTYKDYISKWDKITEVFSKDAVLKGSFDKFAVSPKGKRGTTTVDNEFLAEIEKWREILAKTIAYRNKNISLREINFAVQQTIDRILFLRLCEDRGIESYGQLRAISSGDRTYPRLCEIFEKADQKYNSGLFYFTDEKDRAEPPDKLTLNLIIDDKDLKWILHSLYYPQSPYEFSVLPAEILGNVYEQFLGKVISVSPAYRVKIEPKPEVKKAGGIYYTPAYIVDYIVKNTVGKLIEGKTPKQIESIKILDPACGSGSFLLGAYTFLLNYCLDWYSYNNPEKFLKMKNPPIYEVSFSRRRSGDESHCEEHSDEAISSYRLTVSEKKRILLNNIFGVDIDSQAVEVTKLSLLLKVLEGESSQTLENQYRLFHERALPDLANNIKCGNSLIAPDFFDNPDIDSLDDDLRQKINPFEWKKEFPNVFKQGGFDVVIENPPYLSFYSKQSIKKEQLFEYDYLLKHADFLKDFPTKRINSVMFFLKKSVEVLCSDGVVGLIIDMSVHEDAYRGIRKFIFENTILLKIIPYISAFQKVSSSQSILIASKQIVKDSSAETEIVNCDTLTKSMIVSHKDLIGENEFNFQYSTFSKILAKILNTSHDFLKDISTLSRGMVVSKDFVVNKNIGRDCYKCVFGTNISRYFLEYPSLEQERNLRGRGKFIIHSKEFESKVNAKFKRQGRNTINVIGDRDRFLRPKLFVRYTPTFARIEATYDSGGYFSDHTLSLINDIQKYDPRYLLGLLNSKLLGFYALNKRLIKAEKGKIPQFPTKKLGEVPIRTINFKNPVDKSKHNKIVKLVERMLDLHKKLAAAKVPDEKTKIQRQINNTDKQIDQLVYDLYSLTDEEIKIVEQNT